MDKTQTYNWANSANKIFYVFFFIHALVWTLLPTFFFPTIQIDTAEGLIWGRLWQFGYYKHPFLAPWLTQIASSLTQGLPGWSLYFLSQIFVVLTFIAVWKLAGKFLSPMQALVAVLLLEGIHFYSFESTQFDPNVAMLPCWAWFTYFAYEAFKNNRIMAWILAGLMAGLWFFAKYETFILIIPLLLWLVCNKELWRYFCRPGFYVAVAIAFLVFSPNLMWLIHHQFLPVKYAFGEANQVTMPDEHPALQFLITRFFHFGDYFL